VSAARVLEHDWRPVPLPANVVIGERSWLHSSFAFLHYESRHPVGVSIGDDSGVYIGTLFDLGPEGRLSIGDFCTIAGPIISSNHAVEIGHYAFISYHVVIADSVAALPARSYPAVQRYPGPRPRGGDISIGENVWIGTRAVIVGNVTLGEGAIIGAATVVDFDVAPFAIVAGSPARVVGWARPGSGSTAPKKGPAR
jgi:acetyltransferase-like isoleucine patch superfamily enzyme